MKNGIRFVGIVLFVLAFSGAAHAAIVCSDSITSPSFGGTEILSLSSSDNAHGEIPSLSGYTVRILCKDNAIVGPITLTNDGTGTSIVDLIGLSTSSNAHAEVGSLTAYTNKIKLGTTAASGTLEVQIADRSDAIGTNNSCASFGPNYASVVELSGQTNAHLKSPYSGLPANTYPITICVQYNPTGTPGGTPATNLVTLTNVTSSAPVILSTDTWSTTVGSNTLIHGDTDYTYVNSLQIVALCDLDDLTTGAQCLATDNYTAFATEIGAEYLGTGSAIIIPGSVQAENYRDTGCPSCLSYSALVGIMTGPPHNLTVNPNASLNSLPAPVFSENYSFDAGALGLIDTHHYRLLAIDLAPYYTFNSTNYLTPEQVYSDNFDYIDFLVDDGVGPGPTCGDGTCEIGEICPADCPTGAGGDEIAIGTPTAQPGLWIKGQGISVNITAVDKRMDLHPTGVDIQGTLIIRDEDGKMIAGFDPAPISFHFDSPPSGTAATSAITVEIEAAGLDNAAFVVGETYTLYFKADAQPNEIITNNNAVTLQLVKTNPETPLAIPDQPWWMSVVMVSIVVGWLFLSTRKRNE